MAAPWGTVPSAAGVPSPAPAAPLLSPEQLQALTAQGLITPESASMVMAKLQAAGVGAPAAEAFAPVLAQAGQPAEPPPPQPKPARPPKPRKLTPQQEREADAWEQLTGKVVWVNPKEVPLGTHTTLPIARLPKAAQQLLGEMYPERIEKGEVPLGWSDPGNLPQDQQGILAQLILLGDRERKGSTQ